MKSPWFKVAVLLCLIIPSLAIWFGGRWRWGIARDIPTEHEARIANLPYSGRLSTGETVVWDTQDCVWTYRATQQVVLPGPSNDLELWRVCMKDRRARRPTVSFEAIGAEQ